MKMQQEMQEKLQAIRNQKEPPSLSQMLKLQREMKIMKEIMQATKNQKAKANESESQNKQEPIVVESKATRDGE